MSPKILRMRFLAEARAAAPFGLRGLVAMGGVLPLRYHAGGPGGNSCHTRRGATGRGKGRKAQDFRSGKPTARSLCVRWKPDRFLPGQVPAHGPALLEAPSRVAYRKERNVCQRSV